MGLCGSTTVDAPGNYTPATHGCQTPNGTRGGADQRSVCPLGCSGSQATHATSATLAIAVIDGQRAIGVASSEPGLSPAGTCIYTG